MNKSVFMPVSDNGMGLSRTDWAISMMALMMSDVFKGWRVELSATSFPYPEGAANIETQDFLDSGCDWILFIDTDIVFQPNHVRMLLEHDVPLVAGLYPKKQPGLEWPILALPDNPRPFDKREQVLCEVQCIARGFTKIHRSVFDQMKKIVPQYSCPMTHRMTFEFWRNLMGGHSDDFNFCNNWRSLGGQVLVDQRCIVKHAGSITYPIKGTFSVDRPQSN